MRTLLSIPGFALYCLGFSILIVAAKISPRSLRETVQELMLKHWMGV